VELKKLYPEIKVIILTMNIDTLMVNAAMSLGAYSYLLKSADPQEIAKTIRQCHQSTLLNGSSS
jgi:DNA-binding NarL/FixJ family response regulator